MESILTFDKLKIFISKLNLEKRKNLAKQMVKDNDYLFVLDNDIIFKMIDHLDSKELIELFKEFDNIGILDEYTISLNKNKVNVYLSRNGIPNIINQKENNKNKGESLFVKILTIMVTILLIISYIIFSFHYKLI